ncbi:MAG: hypothetical protein ABEJ87_05700 [Candidatus Nanohalobium sp.]
MTSEGVEALKLISMEEERRSYRDPVKFLTEHGFPAKLGDILEADLGELEEEGLLTSRHVNAEATVKKDEAIEHEFREVRYYSFTDELVDELGYSFGEEGEASEREEEFLEAVKKVEENNPTEGVPVSVLRSLRPGEDSLEVDESFEKPLELLESLSRKGLVCVESDSRGRLSRDVFYSEKLGEDVFMLTVVDRVYL